MTLDVTPMEARVSHRDRRVARDIARSAWGMLALVVALGALSLAAPLEAVRFAAVIGLAVAGGVFLWQSRRLISDYVRDLESVQVGRPRSGRVLVEVSSDVGYDAGGRRSPRALPPVRRHPKDGRDEPPPAPRAP